MKLRILVLIVLSSLLTASSPAGACLDRAMAAFVAAVESRPVSAGSLHGCRPPNLDLPPAGSGNWPILASAALYVGGNEDSRWLLPWLSGAEGRWGHNGRESGSTIYAGLNWSAALAVRHHACARGDAELCDAAGAWLRAGFAKWALAAKPQAPHRIVFRQGQAVAERSRLDVVGYFGPFAHLVGDRQGEKPDRGRFMGSWVELTPVHPLIAWAADVPGRRYKPSMITSGERSLPLWVAKTLTGQSYSQTLPLGIVGLNERERETLRAYLAAPTNPELAAELVSWLSAYPSNSQTVTYLRYTSGDVVVVMSHTNNANKTGAVITAGLGNRSIWLLPSSYAGVGAATAQGRIENGRAIGTSNDGGRMELDLRPLGPIAWQAVWDTEGARLNGEEVPEPAACLLADLKTAVDTASCLAQESATPAEVVPLLEPVQLILDLLADYEDLPPEGRAAALERLAETADALATGAREAAEGLDTDSPTPEE